MSDNPDRLPGLNLLSLDGGGIMGLSSLLIVREIMSRLQERGRLDKMPEPWECFDLIAGTGTGAISAVMLGRLRFSITDAITTYIRLMSTVFSAPKSAYMGGKGAFKATVLERELQEIIQRVTGDGGERMVERVPADVACKVVVYAMSAYNLTSGLPREFRSYSSRTTALTNCTIWEALRASTTHPELFKDFKVGNRGEQEWFVHGGLGCSNPTARLLEEAKEVFPNRKVASIVSIGAGHAQTIQVAEMSRIERMLGYGATAMGRVLRAAYEMASDNERVAEEMARRFANGEFGYYRLNVEQGMQGIEPKEWERQDDVAAHTQAYMARITTKAKLGKVVDSIRLRKAVLETAQIDGRVASSLWAGKVRTRHCPPPSARFTRREAPIIRVTEYFSNRSHKRRVFVLYGLGGAGKTQLALKCAELMEQRFTDIIFVDASSRESIEAALADFASARHLGSTHRDTLQWLASRHGECLVIFDNADDPAVGLRNYFPWSSECDILVTTRHQGLIALAQSTDATYHVSKMEFAEAKELLLSLAGIDNKSLGAEDREALNCLLQQIGCLALAVAQAGAFILSTRRSIPQYYGMLSKRQRELLEGGQGIVLSLDRYEQTVYTTWDLSFQQLSAHAKVLLFLISFLHHDGILEQIFHRATVNALMYVPKTPPSTVEQAEQAAQEELMEYLKTFEDSTGAWNDILFLSCITELVSLSLLTFDQANQSYSLHPLVQDWARTMVPDRDLAVEKTTLLLALAIGWGNTSIDHAFQRAMVSHVNVVVSLGTGAHSPNTHINHTSRFACVYHEIGWYDKEIALHEQVIAARKRILGVEHPDTLRSEAKMGLAYIERGRLVEAETLGVQVSTAQKRVLGDDHPDTLFSMSNLAIIYHQQGRLAEAETLGVSVLGVRERVLGGNHPSTLFSKANLAATYSEQGRLAEAEALEQFVLKTRERELGKEHPDTLLSMANLAETYRQQGRLAEAEVLNVFVLDVRNRVLGDEHPETLRSMANLAVAYNQQGRHAEAEALNVSVLATRKRVLGDEHPDILLSMANLAMTYWRLGRLAEEEELEESVLAIRKRVLGHEHPDTILSMRNLANTYSRRGKQVDSDALRAKANAIEAR